MLLLKRKPGESIIIGDDISVTILSVNSYHVRVGINAPNTMSVQTEEIYDKIQNKGQTDIMGK